MGKAIAGMPCWTDLASPDVAASRRFYEGLFGWTSTVAEEPEAGGYTTFFKDGKTVAAVGPLMGEGQQSAWMTYFAIADADATTARIEGAYGKVLMAPMDVMGYGRMGVFLDPSDAAFAIWQAGSMSGEDISGAPGSRSWNELRTRDTEGAKSFYGDVFAWRGRDIPGDSTPYTVFEIRDAAAAGMMPLNAAQPPVDVPPHWMVYFEVADTDATAAKASELGGSVFVPPTDNAAGRLAVLVDPHGAHFSVIKSNPTFQP